MQHEIQSCQQDQDIQFITCEGTVSCAQIGNAVRKKTSKQIHHNFKTNIWYGIQTRNDEVLRPVFASFEVLSIRLTIENGIERLRVGCQFTRSVEIERFHGRYRWVEIYFHAASHIPYLYIGINTLRLIDLSDINHALRRMSNDGAQVRRMRRCFT